MNAPSKSHEQSLSERTQELSLKIGLWPREPLRIHEDHLDDLLLWSSQQRSSDTTLQTDHPVYIEVDGILGGTAMVKPEGDCWGCVVGCGAILNEVGSLPIVAGENGCVFAVAALAIALKPLPI